MKAEQVKVALKVRLDSAVGKGAEDLGAGFVVTAVASVAQAVSARVVEVRAPGR